MKEINLENILIKCTGLEIKNKDIKQLCLLAMKEACRQTLELAANNVKIIGYYEEPRMLEGIRLKKFKRTWENNKLNLKVETNLTIDKQSILDTINQIK